MTDTGEELAGIEYAGLPGISNECQRAVMRLLQCREDIANARILTHKNEHCLLLTTVIGDHVAIKSGFASGYGGGAPTSFSYTLRLLEMHGIEIDEYDVDEAVIRRLELSALTRSDLEQIEHARPIRPTRWHDYILDKHYWAAHNGELLRLFKPIIPYAIVDDRLADIALTFWENPDDKLLKGYRRLEDIVRTRTGMTEHGKRLFSNVFNGEEPTLYWEGLENGEKAGRVSLFIGAYGAHRNPRAHRELEADPQEQLSEFLLLNHLFRLESEAQLSEEES